MSFLTYTEIKEHADEIRQSFDELLSSKRFAARPKSRQWSFFRHSFAVLMGNAHGDFPCDEQTAAQYKFEVSEKLRTQYLRPGNPIKYIFALEHARTSSLEQGYPLSNGYAVRVASNATRPSGEHDVRMQLARVVADAVDAEWKTYEALPVLDLGPAGAVFDPASSAYKRIRLVAENHRNKGLVINNPGNPSTRRLIDVRVLSVRAGEAVVRTKEYWYLRWWSTAVEQYVYIYNEENRQTYFLALKGGEWKVVDNRYPTTKTSTPLRWKRR